MFVLEKNAVYTTQRHHNAITFEWCSFPKTYQMMDSIDRMTSTISYCNDTALFSVSAESNIKITLRLRRAVAIKTSGKKF